MFGDLLEIEASGLMSLGHVERFISSLDMIGKITMPSATTAHVNWTQARRNYWVLRHVRLFGTLQSRGIHLRSWRQIKCHLKRRGLGAVDNLCYVDPTFVIRGWK